jgi:glycine cleavage system aminomethyltransferase T
VTSTTSPRIVRRSALEAAHQSIGARWLNEQIHWPASYEGIRQDAEAAAIASGAGIAEIGPFDELLLRGPGALAAVERLLVSASATIVGHVVQIELEGELWDAWILERDEILLLSPSGGSLMSGPGTALASEEVGTIVMSGAHTALRLLGVAASTIMAELCPDNTTPESLAQGALIQAPLGGVRALIARADGSNFPGYTILITGDEATYIWDTFRAVGADHGITAVRPATVKEMIRS